MADANGPGWVRQLQNSYLSGGSSFFILHGNVMDSVGYSEGGKYHVVGLADFLADRMFGGYDLVLHYDIGRGLRPYPGADPRRLTRMKSHLNNILGGPVDLPRDPTQALRTIDRLLSLVLVGQESRSQKIAILFDYADLICPPGDREPEHLATLLNWARSSVVRRVNLVFVLMVESLGLLHPVLVQSPHTEEIHIPMPSFEEREQFIQSYFPAMAAQSARLAQLSAGLTLTNLDHLMRLLAKEAPEVSASEPSDAKSFDTAWYRRIADLKKNLIEAQCPGLIEFVQPRHTLEMVAGHSAAKARLADDAKLVREGKLDAVPMGYLICGPVGVGKTFLATCYAGTVGIPCVTIRNFRSKYVGETESNIERILTVLRELGPVAVIVDEADAAVGDRQASGDSGTSARVFAQLSSQMGNTDYRGKMIWFLLTCRPDLLPIDLKRQGRCEEHIPLFYPETPEDIREMFLAMARKMKMELTAENLPPLDNLPALSGADIEGILTRASRDAFLQEKKVNAELLAGVIANFRSVRGPEHELQWLAAILECSDLRYLPAAIRKEMESPEGAQTLRQRFRQLQGMFAGG